MIRLIRSFFRKTNYQKLPALHNTLTARWSPDDLTDDVQSIMMTGLAKDPTEAQAILSKHGNDLQRALRDEPRHRQVNWRRRLHAWIMSLEGSEASDPMLRQLKGEVRHDGTYTRRSGGIGGGSSGYRRESGLARGITHSSGSGTWRSATRHRRA